MPKKEKKSSYQFTLRLTDAEAKRLAELKSAEGCRQNVDVVYKAIDTKYQQVFKKPFFA